MKLVIFSIIFSSFLGLTTVATAKADDSSINFWSRSDYQEHMATSYAVAFTSYQLMHKTFEMDQTESLVWSTIGTLALGFVRDKYLFKHDTGMSNYMEANFVGTSAATLVNFTFNF